MNQKITMRIAAFFVILLMAAAVLPEKVSAISASTSVSIDRSVCDVGDSFQVTVSVTSSVPFSLSYNISCGGASVSSCSDSNYGNGVYACPNCGTASSVVYTMTAAEEGDHTVSVTDIKCGNLQDPDDKEKSYTTDLVASIHVRTQAEIDASVSESSIARSLEESRAEDARRAEESRRASEEAAAAEESRRQASIDASEESRRQSIASSEEERNSLEASIAASEDESRRKSEEASIAESRQSAEEATTAESRQSTEETQPEMSSASAESTLPQTETGIVYVTGTAAGRIFYFVSADSDAELPEGLSKASLRIRGKAVFACRGDDYGASVYLVSGTFDQTEEPSFYYYDKERGLLFAEDAVPSVQQETELPAETTAVPQTVQAEQNEAEYVSTGDLLTLCFLSIVLGSGLTFLAVLLKRKK